MTPEDTIVNVATGKYVAGQNRLREACNETGINKQFWTDRLPFECPAHEDVPYAFKAFALKYCADSGWRRLLWCDASIIPIASLGPIWEHTAKHGVWLSRNGFSNYEWTAAEAYQYLFPGPTLRHACEINSTVDHVVATAFAIDISTTVGSLFLDMYFDLASKTRAFCGPHFNSNHPEGTKRAVRAGLKAAPCGPPDVQGHRHDQTAASVIAWRLGIPLTDPPKFFAYRGQETAETILVADGDF